MELARSKLGTEQRIACMYSWGAWIIKECSKHAGRSHQVRLHVCTVGRFGALDQPANLNQPVGSGCPVAVLLGIICMPCMPEAS